jgi:hypothetical protein
MRVRWCLIFVLLLSACSGAATTPAAPPIPASDPAAVHAAWIAALDGNDRQAAIDLMGLSDMRMREESVFSYMSPIQSYKGRAADSKEWPGAFERVEIVTIRDAGAQKEGLSRWYYPLDTLCWRAVLEQVDGAWRVMEFWRELRATACEAE